MLFRGCSIPNALNLVKLGVEIHNCALLLDKGILYLDGAPVLGYLISFLKHNEFIVK